MKYNAKQMNDGKWAVFTGKKYFTSTVTDDKNEAEKVPLYIQYNGIINKLLRYMKNSNT